MLCDHRTYRISILAHVKHFKSRSNRRNQLLIVFRSMTRLSRPSLGDNYINYSRCLLKGGLNSFLMVNLFSAMGARATVVTGPRPWIQIKILGLI